MREYSETNSSKQNKKGKTITTYEVYIQHPMETDEKEVNMGLELTLNLNNMTFLKIKTDRKGAERKEVVTTLLDDLSWGKTEFLKRHEELLT